MRRVTNSMTSHSSERRQRLDPTRRARLLSMKRTARFAGPLRGASALIVRTLDRSRAGHSAVLSSERPECHGRSQVLE